MKVYYDQDAPDLKRNKFGEIKEIHHSHPEFPDLDYYKRNGDLTSGYTNLKSCFLFFNSLEESKVDPLTKATAECELYKDYHRLKVFKNGGWKENEKEKFEKFEAQYKK